MTSRPPSYVYRLVLTRNAKKQWTWEAPLFFDMPLPPNHAQFPQCLVQSARWHPTKEAAAMGAASTLANLGAVPMPESDVLRPAPKL